MSYLDDVTLLITACDVNALVSKSIAVAAAVRDASYKYTLSMSLSAGKTELMPIRLPEVLPGQAGPTPGCRHNVIVPPHANAPIVATELHAMHSITSTSAARPGQ